MPGQHVVPEDKLKKCIGAAELLIVEDTSHMESTMGYFLFFYLLDSPVHYIVGVEQP